MDVLTQLATGLGLAAPAGLNAYLPLLIVAIAARFGGLISLNPQYGFLTSWWVIAILAVLLTVELFADKLPGVDTVNDMIQTVVRPAAGAILFAASNGVVSEINPVLALGAGLVAAGSVHGVKATTRPVITATSGGILNPVVSFFEDGLAAATVLITLFLPLVAVTLFVIIMLGLFLLVWRLRRRRKRL